MPLHMAWERKLGALRHIHQHGHLQLWVGTEEEVTAAFKQLREDGLIRLVRGRWVLTQEGLDRLAWD